MGLGVNMRAMDSKAISAATPSSRMALVKPASTSIFHVPKAKRGSSR